MERNMVWQWCRFAAAAGCFAVGTGFMLVAVFGVNRFRMALSRMHAAALGDTLGILFVFLGLIVMRGFSMDSLKLLLVILFFWMASPVSGHMISRLEAMTDRRLGELTIIRKNGHSGMGGDAGDGGQEPACQPGGAERPERGIDTSQPGGAGVPESGIDTSRPGVPGTDVLPGEPEEGGSDHEGI
jgi:multicomponent Na+:H+ antiporter subunit G